MDSHARGSMAAGILAAVLVVALQGAAIAPARAAESPETQGIVDKARVTLEAFMADKNYGWLHAHLKEAKGALIFPQVLKGGFIVGGSGGTGVLLARDGTTGKWSEPAFYTMGSVTFGLQIGGEAAEVIMLVMSPKALDSLFASSVKLGADGSVAAGPVGGGAKGDITTDFISFARSKGLYAGINFEGSVLSVRESHNAAYYGQDVRPTDIIVSKKVANPGSGPLREALEKAAR